MAQAQTPRPVKLIVGMLCKDESLFGRAEQLMEEFWGAIDIDSAVMPFTHTDYYAQEMGAPLLRRFVAFAELIDPGCLADVKHKSNALEISLGNEPSGRASGLSRPINLDPGYVEPSKLILATTKNYSHRIYIGRSMYAEATLQYHQGRWQGWPYTYPDYANGAYDDFFSRVRRQLMEDYSSQK